MTPMTFDPFLFRESCRQQTREHIEALQGPMGKSLREMVGDAMVDEIIEAGKAQLEAQKEPTDGTTQ